MCSVNMRNKNHKSDTLTVTGLLLMTVIWWGQIGVHIKNATVNKLYNVGCLVTSVSGAVCVHFSMSM